MFSLQKLLVLAVLLGVLWAGFHYIGRLAAARKAVVAGKNKTQKQETNTQDMVSCPQCGIFVTSRKPTRCGRAVCPYG